ncbi:60S ribosomal protein L23-like, partial [Trifolium medium]|nr:60S ribosomal protein L23-like [Trifolium medium]
MSKRARGGSIGNKFLMSLGIKGRLNYLPSTCVGDMVMATVKKGKLDLRKKDLPAIIVRQCKPWRRKNGLFMYFEDNVGVIVNRKGEMKGSALDQLISSVTIFGQGCKCCQCLC